MTRTLRVAALAASLLVAALAFASTASATFLSPTPDPLTGSNFQGGDGNQLDENGHIDWQTLAAVPPGGNGFVVDSPDSTTHDSCFGSPNQKQLNPGGWVFIDCGTAVTPSKTNLLAGWSAVDHTGDTFLYLAFNREAQTGNTYLAFELNQDAGTFRNPAGYDVPCRIGDGDGPGLDDLIISYQVQSGGSPPNVEIVVHRWKTLTASATDPRHCALTGEVDELDPQPYAEGAVNAGSIPNYLSGGSPANFLSGTFGEAALNLSAFFRSYLDNRPCFAFGSISMESHSSTSFTSDLKDFIGPTPLTVGNCSINVDKQVRVRTGDTPSDPTSDTYANSASAVVGSTFDYKFDVSVPDGSRSLTLTDIHDVLGTQTGDPSFCEPEPYLGGDAAHNYGDANDNDVVDPGEHWLFTCSRTSDAGDVATSPLHNTVFVEGKLPGCTGSVSDCGAAADDDASVTVLKATPAISTTAETPVTVGDTISDTATVSGGYNPSGTVQFALYGPGDPDCTGEPVFTDEQTLTNGSATSATYTTTKAGDYHWIASYVGDAGNEPVAGSCGDEGETSHVDKANPSIATTAETPVTVGDTIHDTATVTGGYNPSGTVTFALYGPTDPDCQGEPVFTDTKSLTNGSATSGNYTTTSAGNYHWIASYSGDSNNNTVSGSCGDEGETSHVDKATPSIATTAETPVTVGATIHDMATVTGGYNPSGTVTFALYGPTDPDCQGEPVFTDTKSLTNGSATSGNYTTTSAGNYHWIASYSGDSNNNTVSGSCGDEGETSHVDKANPSISTTAVTPVTVGQTISDTATVSGGYNPTGTVTFTVYGPDNAECSGEGVVVGSSELGQDGKAKSPDYTPAAAGTYRWIASYSGDSNNNTVSGSCGDEGETSHVDKANPSISTTASGTTDLGDGIHDTATVTGGYNPSGMVTFALYGPTDPDCQGEPVFTDTKSLTNGSATSANYTTTSAGNYHWIASYSGDSNNNTVSGSCGDEGETSHVDKATPSISTTASGTTDLGHAIHDTAHVSGSNPTGSVTFTVYGPDNAECSGEGVVVGTSNLDQDGNATSPDYTPTAAGTYRWIASYSGDSNNNPVSGSCNAEGESVAVRQPLLAISKTGPDHAYVGDVITFDITVTNPGSSDVHDVNLADKINGTNHGCDSISGPTGDTNGDSVLQPSETWKYVCTYTVQHADEDATHHVVNTATVTGKNRFDEPVGPVSDDHPVLIVHPAIAIDKSGPARATQGDKVAYTLTVTNPGDASFAEPTVKVADQQCNGDPVALIGKGGDASPSSLDPGDTWTYTCSVQTAAGQTSIHNVASVTGCDRFGKCVNASDDADTVLDAQLVAPIRVTPGSARLLGATGCTARAFNARVRGSKIATVVFALDGKVVKKVKNTKNATLIQLRVDPKKLKFGVHRLVVNVTFQSGSGTKPKTLRLSFQRCGKKLVAPRFTG